MPRYEKIYLNILVLSAICILLPLSAPENALGVCDPEAHICLIAQNRDASTPVQNVPAKFTEEKAAIGGDLSESGEKEYTAQIVKWLNTLPQPKQIKAREILSESHGELQALRKAIYNKKLELAAVRFDNQASLALLPKLGMDLQKLRHVLRKKLEVINSRLLKEAGIRMDELSGEGLWLQPLAKKPRNSGLMNSLKENYVIPVSGLDDFAL